jgi:ribosomal protein S18 acetylase RimI-like enzyme
MQAMQQARFRIERLDKAFNRADFKSDSPALNRYFQEQVTQDIKRKVATCFVAIELGGDESANMVAGYYTLASASVLLADLPPSTGKRLPRYPTVPAVRMGRLAVAQKHKGQGLGGALLADALARSAQAEIAAFALLVDAKDASAMRFYQHHGFISLPSNALSLFLPLACMAPA